MEKQQTRYVLGKRAQDGRYPVTVDGAPTGTVHRRHGSWYTTIPGHRILARFRNRFDAAEHLVTLTDRGIRPTVPAPGDRPAVGLDMRTAGTGLAATRTYQHLVPDLRPTLPNLIRAVEAMARLAQLGWTPLEGYPGADQGWFMECRLCGWKGHRFWSHLRGRNGDQTPRPINRHPGCIPVADMPDALLNLGQERRRHCPCPVAHPTTVDAARTVLAKLGDALRSGAMLSATIHARALLEPCPASTLRAAALRLAHDQRTRARRTLGQPIT
ncbi:hypothetical protein ACFV2Z_37140 [Streptomyces sp. NPDC059688]|uniref:hypothetical protein n=1 Tax=Streptomyces sp. NPDC059688 TaxID=3346906 RepID=UPI0036B8DA96